MWNDLRYAARILRKNPTFAAISVLAVALGIGANTAVSSLFDAVVLRPLPFAEPRQLVRMWESYGTPGNAQPVSYPNFEDWRGWNRTFSCLAAFTGSSAVLAQASRCGSPASWGRQICSRCWVCSPRWDGDF